MTTVQEHLSHALAYAAAGIDIFPCHSVRSGVCSCGCRDDKCKIRGKHPRMKEWQNHATTDAQVIRQWWQQWPRANIAAAMAKSGLFASDIDPRNGGEETWSELERAAAERGETLTDTWTNLTGGGGVHYIYAVPDGFVCRTDSVGTGVDAKWHGYVLLPPSSHISEREYAWEIGEGPFDRAPGALPSFLIERVSAKPTRDDLPPSSGRADPASLPALLEEPCPEGKRHNTLISLLGYVRTEVDQDEAERIAQEWNAARCVPPLEPEYVSAQVADTYTRWPGGAKPDVEGIPVASESKQKQEQAQDAPPEPPTVWRIITARQLRKMELPPIEWVLEGRVPRGKYVVVSGDSGLGKSWWILALALHSAIGVPFLDLETKPLRTLYIDEENGISEAQRRLCALMDGLGIPEDTDVGVDFLIDEAIKLNGLPVAARLTQVIRAGNYDCVMTDSMIRFYEGNENNSDEVARFHDVIKAVRRATGVTWFMLQHLNKAGANGDKVSPGDRLRGSGEFKAYPDTHLQLRGADKSGAIVLHVEKQRGGILAPDLVYRMDGNTLLGEPVTLTALGSTAAALGAANAALMHVCDVLREKNELTVGALKDALLRQYGIAPRTAARALDEGRKSGVLLERMAGKNVYLRLAEEFAD